MSADSLIIVLFSLFKNSSVRLRLLAMLTAARRRRSKECFFAKKFFKSRDTAD